MMVAKDELRPKFRKKINLIKPNYRPEFRPDRPKS